MFDCNEWKTEKCHECENMGKVKRLELWWQLYRTSLPVRDFQADGFLFDRVYFLKYLEHPQSLKRVCILHHHHDQKRGWGVLPVPVCILNKAFVRWACHGSHRHFFYFFGPRKRRRLFFLQYSSPNLYVQNYDSLLLYVDLTGHNRNMAKFPRHNV